MDEVDISVANALEDLLNAGLVAKTWSEEKGDYVYTLTDTTLTNEQVLQKIKEVSVDNIESIPQR
jgi:predicted transcriptional regulator